MDSRWRKGLVIKLGFAGVPGVCPVLRMKTVHHAVANLARINSGFRWRLGCGQLCSSPPQIRAYRLLPDWTTS
jgi:hypothetical protein